MKKACLFGIVAVTLVVVSATPRICRRLDASRQSFQQYFQALDPAGTSLNPIQRVLFSLVLTKTGLPAAEK